MTIVACSRPQSLERAVPAGAYRYAVYFAPAIDEIWWQKGSAWLGRCAATQQLFELPAIGNILPDRMSQYIAHPRRYGFHATLRAPFVLREGFSEQTLIEQVALIGARFKPFLLPRFRVTRIGDFLALTLDTPSTQVQQIEEQCVTALQSFAAPLSPNELERRRAANLSEQEDGLLLRWGYPYVLDRFRFHLSLTGSLQSASVEEVVLLAQAAQNHFHHLPLCTFSSLAIFAEPTQGADFVLVAHCPLTGTQ